MSSVRAPGSALGRYTIVECLGQGGMGVVYRATDPRLEREVAIKLLTSPGLSDVESRRRLRLEARAVSRLIHPNIATLFDLDSDGATDFLVLEYVPGNTLADQIESGPLPEARARAIAIEIAEALIAAHDQGIVHRDLKPMNVVLTPRGRAKVLDFGLAQFDTPNVDSRAHTVAQAEGGLSGTIPYMSPEQVRGERVDARTDLWSLGVMLHEMCTGRRPFEGRDHATLLYQIAHTPAPSAAKLRPELSAELVAIIARLLEKDPTRRYPDAAAVVEALRGVTTTRGADETANEGAHPRDVTVAAMSPATAGGVAPTLHSPASHPVFRSLAVLPLVNRSGDQEQEFFADGMTDALITDLAQISALRVISRTSAMRFKASDRPLPDIARELRVDAIVEGSVLLAGGRVRLTAQLIEAATDRSLWAQSYERELTDILTLQRELARTIADEVRVRVTPEESERLRPKGPVNAVAHVAYLRGRALWNRYSTPSIRESVGHYEEALAADPRYALAYAGLADSYATLGNTNAMPPAEAYSRARDAAERGLAIDPNLAELHASLAYVHRFHDWDWPAAERSFQRALAINPGYATGRRWYAQFLAGLARHSEAIAEGERALELDPLSLIIHTALGDCLFYARRYDSSVAYLRRCLELDPSFGPAHTDLARSLEHLGQFQDALQEFLLGTGQASAGPFQPSTGLATLLVRAGRREEGLAMARTLAASAGERHVSAYGIASVYAVAGDHPQALDWLERAYAERDGTLVWIKVHPRMDGLRSEPRFRELLCKMRLDA